MSMLSALNSGVGLLEALAGDSFTIAGQTYKGSFRTGGAVEQAEFNDVMRAHGYPQAGTCQILQIARSRLSAPPVAWKRQKLKRITPTPEEYTVISVNTDDPNVFTVVMIGRQA